MFCFNLAPDFVLGFCMISILYNLEFFIVFHMKSNGSRLVQFEYDRFIKDKIIIIFVYKIREPYTLSLYYPSILPSMMRE